MHDRERDAEGRARSARPRDSFGRPLPPGSVGVPRIPDDLELPPDRTLGYAQELLDDGLAFNAHEVLEAAWKNGPFAERQLWQGLAQLAVGLTHIQRGNAKGARTLLLRAAERLERYEPEPGGDHGVDRPRLIEYARALVARLEPDAEIAPGELRPALRGR
ncbi:DUF309 domain-containing protein [Nocardia sp. NPDC050697]|uniref:DUF309 domain-containing protein n=1 Tax=Nocardia sp. NPDC050697 TaxID=3155158 RepID=UPI0033DC9008